MTIRQLYFCAFTFTFALVGSILLLAVVMDIVSLSVATEEFMNLMERRYHDQYHIGIAAPYRSGTKQLGVKLLDGNIRLCCAW